MNLLKFCDASTPAKPAGFDGTAFYVGGATPHVWTPSEISAYSYELKIPIWVPWWFRTGIWTPESDAEDCLTALNRLAMPVGHVFQIDMETAIEPNYIDTFSGIVKSHGYYPIPYGSSSTIFSNPNPGWGYWVATRPGNHDYPGDEKLFPNSVATQWQDFGAYDANVVIDSLPIWGKANPPAIDWTENVIANLPTLHQGITGNSVRTWQGLLNARGYTCQIDGDFGEITEGLTRAFQVHFNVPNSVANGQGDGIVGQHTWTTGITGTAQ